MSSTFTQHPIYEALMMPTDALDKGGLEILRAGLVQDELYVTARRVFKEANHWGDVLADIARRIALMYAQEDTTLEEKEFLADIMEAFVADLGARKVKSVPVKRKAAGRAKKKPAKGRVSARKPAKRTSAKRRKR
ncbi:MAG: DUF5076 domain-containing protein [Xanthobacteraceae bacterium]